MRAFAAGLPSAIAVATLAAAVALVSGCASTEGVEQEQVYQAPDGVAVVDTITTVATVTAIDAASRKVTLTTPDGTSNKFKAAQGVDLSAFRVGEQIGVQVSEAVALQIRNDGTPPGDAQVVALAAAGSSAGTAVFEGDAEQVAARVAAVDPQTRKVTFQLADGTTRTIKAQKGVDLTALAVGSTVVVTYAESVVVAVATH